MPEALGGTKCLIPDAGNRQLPPGKPGVTGEIAVEAMLGRRIMRESMCSVL